MASSGDNALGLYLRDRRGRIEPSAFGLPTRRRRTPGLRREEVAHRAEVSAVWYTWLEQGRGGTPSADVLERLADALLMSAAEREHLFMLAQQRPPAVRYQPTEAISPQLQRVLDSLDASPAYVKTATWDVVAWNRAAAAVLTDYGALPPGKRNILRLIFCDPRVRGHLLDWEAEARFAVAAFRSESVRACANERKDALVRELTAECSEFATIWNDLDVRNLGEGVKQVRHETGEIIGLEYSSFVVDGRPDLGLVIYTPSSLTDRASVRVAVERMAIVENADVGRPPEPTGIGP